MGKEKGKQVAPTVDEEVAEMFNFDKSEQDETSDQWPFEETDDSNEEEEETAGDEEQDSESEEKEEKETEETADEEEETPAGEETEEVEETEEAEEEEVDQNAALLQQLNDLAVSKLKAEDELAKAIKPPTFEELFKDFDVDEVMATSENFKDFLTKFATSVQQQAITGVLQSIPEIMTSHMTRQQALTKIRDDFYSKHKELEPVKQFVAYATTQVASENPDWKLEQVLEEAAKRAYTTLGIKKQVAQSGKKKTKPAFVKAPTASRKPKAKITPLQKELDDLFDL